MKNIFYALYVFILLLTCCKEKERTNCIPKEAKTLFTIIGIHDKDTSYAHYVLIPDYSRECLDSFQIIRLASRYIDTVGSDKPVTTVMLFNSDKDFIPNEKSQVMSDINRSCLVVIGFDKKAKRPDDFIFYNEKGERIYWGPRWLPQGDKSK